MTTISKKWWRVLPLRIGHDSFVRLHQALTARHKVVELDVWSESGLAKNETLARVINQGTWGRIHTLVVTCHEPDLKFTLADSRGRKLRMEWQSPEAEASAEEVKRASLRWFNPLLLPSFTSIWLLFLVLNSAWLIASARHTSSFQELDRIQGELVRLPDSAKKAELLDKLSEQREFGQETNRIAMSRTSIHLAVSIIVGLALGALLTLLARFPRGLRILQILAYPFVMCGHLYDKVFPTVLFEFDSTDGAYYGDGVRWTVILLGAPVLWAMFRLLL